MTVSNRWPDACPGRRASPSASVRFGSEYGLDLGASNRVEGNLRVRTFSDKGNTVGPVTRGVVWPGGFTKEDDLLAGIADRIAIAQRENRKSLGKKDEVRGIVAFVPGQADLDGRVKIFSNLRTLAGAMLQDVDFGRLPEMIRARGARVSPECRVIVTNDVVGGTSEALAQLARRYRDRFRPGLDMLYMATGGGFGVAQAEFGMDGAIRIRATEAGHHFDPVRGCILEEAGASLPALIRNFASRLPVSEVTRQDLIAQNRGEAVTRFEVPRELIPDPLSEAQFNEAADFAVNEYIDSMVGLVALKVLEGSNLAVLSGPVLGGVKEYVATHPAGFAGDLAAHDAAFPEKANRPPFEKVLLNRIWSALDETGRRQFTTEPGFEVITDIDVPDNTTGARYMTRGRFDGRGDRYLIPAEAFRFSRRA